MKPCSYTPARVLCTAFFAITFLALQTNTWAQPPSNDDCGSATSLTPSASCSTVSGSTVNATQSIPAIECNGTTGNANDDVWYKFTAINTTAEITVTGIGYFNAVAELLSGSCNGTSMACADSTGQGETETLHAAGLTAGETYYVRIYEWSGSGSEGDFTVCVVAQCPVTINVFDVTGGGSYCPGNGQLAVGLSGSQTGVSYQLKRNGVTLGPPIPGTGFALSAGNFNVAGTYTVTAIAACDGPTDMNGSAIITWASNQTYYYDGDGDGYCGDSAYTCTSPGAGWSTATLGLDCNDANAGINPAALEICNNGVDDNCNGYTDENIVTATLTPADTATLCAGTSLQLTANTGVGFIYHWYRNNVLHPELTSSSVIVPQSGSYRVAISNGGCSAVSAPTIVIKVLPGNASVTASGNLDICNTGQVLLKAHHGNVTYQWYKNGTPIIGATDKNYLATTTGYFRVQITNNVNGCSKASTILNVYSSCREDEETAASPTFSIYPNPTTGRFVVELKSPGGFNGVADVQVINILGQQVYTSQLLVTDGTVYGEVNAALTPGNYIVRVILADKLFTARLAVAQ